MKGAANAGCSRTNPKRRRRTDRFRGRLSLADERADGWQMSWCVRGAAVEPTESERTGLQRTEPSLNGTDERDGLGGGTEALLHVPGIVDLAQ